MKDIHKKSKNLDGKKSEKGTEREDKMVLSVSRKRLISKQGDEGKRQKKSDLRGQEEQRRKRPDFSLTKREGVYIEMHRSTKKQ